MILLTEGVGARNPVVGGWARVRAGSVDFQGNVRCHVNDPVLAGAEPKHSVISSSNAPTAGSPPA